MDDGARRPCPNEDHGRNFARPLFVALGPLRQRRTRLQGRVINQGPLNLGYIVNMLLSWAGPSSIRRLTVSFGHPVLDGDRVTEGGRVESVQDEDSERRTTCTVWLKRDDERVVSGTAVVCVNSASIDT